MAASTAALSYTKYLERLRQQDPGVLLGVLCWYSVEESVRVKHDALIATLAKVGLDSHQPPAPKDEDVFRRVATSHARKRVETDNPDVYENYMIRDVKRGPDVFTKQIVVERVNGKGKKLGYEPSVQMEFTVATGKIIVTPLGRTRNHQALNLAELIKRDYRADRGSLNAYSIRELLRRCVNGTGATCVKPTGGVYFIMEDQQPTVKALVALSAGLEGVSFHPVPLINDAEQQAMLRTAFEAETKGMVEQRMDQIDEMLAGPEITARRYSDLIAEMKEIQERTGTYRDLLDDNLAYTDLLLTGFEKKMARLFLHTKGE